MLCQCVHSFLLEADFIIEPQGVGQNTGHRAVIAVVGVPDSGGLGPEGVHIAAAQQGEDLLPGSRRLSPPPAWRWPCRD